MFLIENIKRAFFPFYKAEKTKKIFKILNKDKKKQAMFVGGCVRKYLTNDNVDDIDIATTLTPEEIIAKFSNSDFEIKKTGIEHGTLTLVINKKAFEITTLREDVSTDGRHAKISFTEDWKKDSERRDFTINAIYLDEFGNVYDPQFGVKDLKNKKIRFIGDPNKRIREDYLRILRYIRFSIQYKNYEHDDETSKAIKVNLDGIAKLSKERIYLELKKIIKLKNFSDILKSKFLLS
jgi:poly(A) polymerase